MAILLPVYPPNNHPLALLRMSNDDEEICSRSLLIALKLCEKKEELYVVHARHVHKATAVCHLIILTTPTKVL